MSDIHSVDVEDDQFAYRYDTRLLIDRRDEDLDEDVIADYITEHFEGNCLIAVCSDCSHYCRFHQYFCIFTHKTNLRFNLLLYIYVKKLIWFKRKNVNP